MKKTLKAIMSRLKHSEEKPVQEELVQEKPGKENNRKYIRYPYFSILEIVFRNKLGHKKSIKITLHNESHMGFGAIYVGAEATNKKDEFYVHEKDNVFRRVKLSWSKELIKNVFFLGFQILEEEYYTEIPS